ncbi:MAG TPA: site-2 protease family protein, partial [Terracidiphilus sp.]
MRECPSCGQELMVGAQACPACHVLVHGAELNKLAREAQALEAKGDYAQAREVWNRSLSLLPHDATQARWVREKLRALEVASSSAPDPKAKAVSPWVKRLGPLAPLAVVLAKGKVFLLAIFKLKFLFSFFSFIGLYVAWWGWRFGVGFAVCILIHELGHFVDIKRRGLPAEMPVFLPGLGAYVRWNALGVTKRQIAQISLAGPLAGWLAAAGCYWLYLRTGHPFWAALARTGALINVLNLIPVWTLDGGQAIGALGKTERAGIMAAALACFAWTSSPVFLLVAAGACWRLFTKDQPRKDDWGTWFYFVAVMGALAWTMSLVPA